MRITTSAPFSPSRTTRARLAYQPGADPGGGRYRRGPDRLRSRRAAVLPASMSCGLSCATCCSAAVRNRSASCGKRCMRPRCPSAKGLAIMALSGVEPRPVGLAGKAAAPLPVARLLGGTVGQPSRPMPRSGATCRRTCGPDTEPQAAHGGQAPAERVAHVTGWSRRARRRWTGLSAHARRLDEVGLATRWRWPPPCCPTAWTGIEEPLPADDLKGYAALSGRCPIPIAGRARVHRGRIAELIERGCIRCSSPMSAGAAA